MMTILLLAVSHVIAFVAGAFMHKWLASKATQVVTTITGTPSTAPKA